MVLAAVVVRVAAGVGAASEIKKAEPALSSTIKESAGKVFQGFSLVPVA